MARWRGKGQIGQSALEMALTMPLVFVMIMGCLELGVGFNAYVTLVAAAREGARAGAVYLYDSTTTQAANDQNRANGTGTATPYSDNIRNTVVASMGILKTTAPNFDINTSITITYAPAVNPVETRKRSLVSVQVTYRHDFLTQVIGGMPYITMTAQASARIE